MNSPSYVIADARARLREFVTNDLLSPIMPERERPLRQATESQFSSSWKIFLRL
ncbi:hypothetical protein [Burkholderia gladioli]|uniref:hypothetical protein n=1 Tax=Burkholderia gladioli TaxID=28095 RepID=UPI0016420438|nr:hypothetical protein [Burkholderia gladioli]